MLKEKRICPPFHKTRDWVVFYEDQEKYVSINFFCSIYNETKWCGKIWDEIANSPSTAT